MGGYMNKRNTYRYSSELLPNSFNSVYISWDGNSPIESNVVNYSAQGIRVLIPSSLTSFDIPRINSTIRVLMPIEQKWFNGLCVSTTNEQDGSVTMGIYFNNHTEQNLLQNLLYKSFNNPVQAYSFVKHEWEELVDKLCGSDDPHLRKIGYSELNNMTIKEKSFKRV